MKRIYVPYLFSKENSVVKEGSVKLFPVDPVEGFYSLDEAEKHAQKLALLDPKSKVVIFEAYGIIEPRRIEYAFKKYNESGELVA